MRSVLRFAFLLLAVVGLTRGGLAQNTNSGDIRGTVTDASGAAVAGVSVKVISVDTGETREYITNENGIYDTVSIRPGTYNVTFSKAG